ncbi:MAG: response regulator transcription factor [bacterium]
MINILIADDHVLLREGLKKVIKSEIDMNIAGEFDNGTDVVGFFRKNDCDLVILDISFPERSGFDVLADIKRIKPNVKVIMLSMFPESLYAVRALKLGAKGYMTKDSPPEEIINAIRLVMNGKRYISENFAQRLAESVDSDIKKARHENLSEREMEVLIKIAQGRNIKEIADELTLSPSSVNTYRARILDKMNLKSNTEIIYYAIQYGLVKLNL